MSRLRPARPDSPQPRPVAFRLARPRSTALGGTAAAALGALALLVLGCVFVAMAGPRASVGIRTRALTRTVDTAPPSQKTIDVTANWNDFVTALGGDARFGQAPDVTPAQLGEVKGEVGSYLTRAGVPLGPSATAWAGMSTAPTTFSHAAASAQSTGPPRVELLYRDTLARYAALTAGRYPAAAGPTGGKVAVAVTQQTAARFSLHVGSTLQMPTDKGVGLVLLVTGIVSVHDPQATFWTSDPAAAAPQYNLSFTAPSYWLGAFLAGPSSLAAMQADFGGLDLSMQWQYQLNFDGLAVGRAAAMAGLLNRVTTASANLQGPLSAVVPALSISTGAAGVLSSFLAAETAVDSVLSLLFVGLAVIGAVVLLLAARMMTAQRAAEYALLRARGASLAQLVALTLRDTAAAVLPAAVVAVAVAVALTPGAMPSLALWLTGVTVAVALAGPPLAAAIAHRPLRHGGLAGMIYLTGAGQRAEVAPRRSPVRRLVAELGMTAAAVGALVVLRTQGLPQNGGLNAFASAVPVLVAVPAAILVMRLYPLALRAMLRLSARQPGVTGFLAVAKAGRAAAGSVLPSFALVLALTLAAFAGMVRDTVTRGEVISSWQTTGADATIGGHPVAPAAARALAAVPGVQHVATVGLMTWTERGSQPVTVLVVDPASYAALTASTPWPRFPAAKLARPTVAGPVPVLASRPAAAQLGAGVAELQVNPVQPQTVPVRVAGLLSGTPALPALPTGGAGNGYLIVPSWAVPPGHRTLPTLLLLTGAQLDSAKLTSVAARLMPGAVVRLRSDVLAGLSASPLTHGAYLGFAAGIAAATGFSVAILLLDLALGAAERESTLARLATMGIGAGQARRLTMLETLPAVLAATVAGACSALVLVPLTSSALNLSVFTGSGASVPVRPDLTALGLPAAGLVVLAVGTLTFQIWSGRRRGVTTALRVR